MGGKQCRLCQFLRGLLSGPYSYLLLGLSLLVIVAPALAEYLGPDRHVIDLVKVRDPDNDVWTLTHVDPVDGLPDTCFIVHTCEAHPSVERQLALCGWVADNSGCEEAYKFEEVEYDLPEATISWELVNCGLNNGWCTKKPTLLLSGSEPLEAESIYAIEGTLNQETFYCEDDVCGVPFNEGENTLAFWALSTYGDSSLKGEATVFVDTTPPQINLPDEWKIWEEVALNVKDAGSTLAAVNVTIHGGQYGDRKFHYGSPEAWLPDTISWDRRFDNGIVAPVGVYEVTVEAQDMAGNAALVSGLVIIPYPGLSPTRTPTASTSEAGGGKLTTPTSTSPSLTSAPTQTPERAFVSLDTTQSQDQVAQTLRSPVATNMNSQTTGERTLWGAAALTAATTATAYAIERAARRRLHHAFELSRKREEAAWWAARAARLSANVEAWRRSLGRRLASRTPGAKKTLAKPCNTGQALAGAGLIAAVDLTIGLGGFYVIVATGGVSPAAIAAEALEVFVVLPLNIFGIYLMAESGCVGTRKPPGD